MAPEIEIKAEKSQKTQEKDTGSNHVVPVMLTFYDSDLKTVKERSRSRLQSVHKFQRNKNIMNFHSNINKGADPFTRGSRFVTQDIQITNLQRKRQKLYDTKLVQ